MEPKTTIALDQYFVSSDNQTATAPGATDTATVTFVGVADATKTVSYTTTDPEEIEALAGGSVWSQQMILVPAAPTTPGGDATTPGGDATSSASTDASTTVDSSAAA